MKMNNQHVKRKKGLGIFASSNLKRDPQILKDGGKSK